MAANLADVGVCSTIFLGEDGAPIEFFIKPGPTKDKLLPFIEKGGGVLTSISTSSKDVIKLANPNEGLVEGFVSTEFIFDSVKKQFIQDMDKYIIKHDKNKKQQFVYVKQNNNVTEKKISKNTVKSRKKYSYTDDVAIIDYVNRNVSSSLLINGNTLFKEMEDDGVTDHSWQSMKKHYKMFLFKKRTCDLRPSIQFQPHATKKRKSSESLGNTARIRVAPSTSKQGKDEGLSLSDAYAMSDNEGGEKPVTSDEEPLGTKRHRYRKRQAKDGDLDEEQVSRRTTKKGKEKAVTSDDEPLGTKRHRYRKRQAKDCDLDEQQIPRSTTKKGKEKAVTSDEEQLGTRKQRYRKRQAEDSDLDEQQISRSTTKGKAKAVTSDEEQLVIRRKRYRKRQAKDSDLDEEQVLRTSTKQVKGKPVTSDGEQLVTRKLRHRKRQVQNSESSHEQKANNKADEEITLDEFDKSLLDYAEMSIRDDTCNGDDADDSDVVDADDLDHARALRVETSEDDGDSVFLKRLHVSRSANKESHKTTSNSKSERAVTPGKQTTDRLTRSQRPLDSPRACSSARASSSPKKYNMATRANSNLNHKPNPNEPTPKSTENKDELTPESCSRRLFVGDAEETAPVSRSKATVSPLDKSDTMWHVKKLFANYRMMTKTKHAEGLTTQQLIHALYVSNGSIEDAKSYLRTRRLSNGEKPWSTEENEAILSNNKRSIHYIIYNRGKSSVEQRKSFLKGCR